MGAFPLLFPHLAVVFSGFGCAHRVACDIGLEPTWPALDKPFNKFLEYVRDRS